MRHRFSLAAVCMAAAALSLAACNTVRNATLPTSIGGAASQVGSAAVEADQQLRVAEAAFTGIDQTVRTAIAVGSLTGAQAERAVQYLALARGYLDKAHAGVAVLQNAEAVLNTAALLQQLLKPG